MNGLTATIKSYFGVHWNILLRKRIQVSVNRTRLALVQAAVP